MPYEYPSVTARAARRRGDVDALLDLLVGTDRNERISAAYNLGEMKAAEAVGPLVRCLHAHDWVVRSSAVTALAEIGDRRAIPAIFEVGAEDESIDVRVAAMTALSSLGDQRVADLILAALVSDDIPHRRWFYRWAIRKLIELDATGAVGELEKAKRHAGPVERWRLRRAIRLLSH